MSIVHARAFAPDRPKSEDRAEVFERGDVVIVVIADGAGGLAGGAVASDAFVDAARSAILDASFDVLDVKPWLRLFANVDASLSANMAGETTAVVVVLGAGGLVGVSAGDSEAWMINARAIDDLTRNQEKLRLGSGQASPASFRRDRLDGVLVAGTDGLFKYAPAEKIAATVRDHASGAHERLIDLVRLASGGYPDDVSVVVAAHVI